MSQISCPTVGPQLINARQFVHRKPSMVVRSVIHGLQEALKRDDFALDMGTFGTVSCSSNICTGCMATVTMQSLFNVRFTLDTIRGYTRRSKAANVNIADFHALEEAVDALRENRPVDLYEFCGIEDIENRELSLPYRVASYDGPIDLPADNRAGYLLSGKPTETEVEIAIARLDKFAKLLEAKGV